MSQDPIAAISGAALNTVEAAQAAQGQAEVVDLRTLGGVNAGGGAAVSAPPPGEPSPSSAMNLQSLATQFSDGLKHGFYAGDINRLMGKVELLNVPDSGVGMGDVAMELINVQAKVGIADGFAKVSSKLSEGLQTLVVRQA
jgi:hypothetical protein